MKFFRGEIAMWSKKYKDYLTDSPLLKNQVEPGKGIIGCEMHDLNGWGNSLHVFKKKKKGFAFFLTTLFLNKKIEE